MNREEDAESRVGENEQLGTESSEAEGSAKIRAGQTESDGADKKATVLSAGETATGGDAPHAAEDPYEGAVPPGYDWPTHGGYLGCLMGVITLSFVGLLLAAPALAVLTYTEAVPLPVAWLITATVFLACIIAGGRLGWWLGRRFYRAYPQSRPTWGEHDDAQGSEASSAAAESESGEAPARV